MLKRYRSKWTVLDSVNQLEAAPKTLVHISLHKSNRVLSAHPATITLLHLTFMLYGTPRPSLCYFIIQCVHSFSTVSAKSRLASAFFCFRPRQSLPGQMHFTTFNCIARDKIEDINRILYAQGINVINRLLS